MTLQKTGKKVHFKMDGKIDQLDMVLDNTLKAIAGEVMFQFEAREVDRLGTTASLSSGEKKKLEAVVLELKGHVKQFKETMTPHAFVTLQAEINKSFAHHTPALNQPATCYGKIIHGLISIFRAFFRVFDVCLTIFSKQTMAATETPFAQKLVGRKHFFEHPETQLGKEAVKLNRALNQALNQFDSLIQNPKEAAPSIQFY